MNKKANCVWRGMWLTLAKAIWTHRNRIVFYGGQVHEIEIFVAVQLHVRS